MKQKIGVLLLILNNLAFIYLAIMLSILSFGIIVAPINHERGIELVKFTTYEILKNLLILTLIFFSITYLLLRKLIKFRKSILASIITTLIGLIIFIGFYISARNSFMNYADSNTKLSQYLDKTEIKEVNLITQNKTIKVINKEQFIAKIGSAKYKPGLWKYAKTIKINIIHINGKTENIDSNGELYGSYQHKYFSTNSNIIKEYLNE